MAPKQTAVAVEIEPQQIMLTIEQASRLLGATPWAIRRMLYAGELPYKRAGKRNVIPRAALEDYASRDLIREGTQIGKRK
jgi:excisionase family DNA binding protein